jgi:hypothetical protein
MPRSHVAIPRTTDAKADSEFAADADVKAAAEFAAEFMEPPS